MDPSSSPFCTVSDYVSSIRSRSNKAASKPSEKIGGIVTVQRTKVNSNNEKQNVDGILNTKPSKTTGTSSSEIATVSKISLVSSSSVAPAQLQLSAKNEELSSHSIITVTKNSNQTSSSVTKTAEATSSTDASVRPIVKRRESLTSTMNKQGQARKIVVPTPSIKKAGLSRQEILNRIKNVGNENQKVVELFKILIDEQLKKWEGRSDVPESIVDELKKISDDFLNGSLPPIIENERKRHIEIEERYRADKRKRYINKYKELPRLSQKSDAASKDNGKSIRLLSIEDELKTTMAQYQAELDEWTQLESTRITSLEEITNKIRQQNERENQMLNDENSTGVTNTPVSKAKKRRVSNSGRRSSINSADDEAIRISVQLSNIESRVPRQVLENISKTRDDLCSIHSNLRSFQTQSRALVSEFEQDAFGKLGDISQPALIIQSISTIPDYA